MRKLLDLLPWALSAWIAYVFLWYLQYKWTGHPGSVELFTILSTWIGLPGIEPYFRVGTGIAELIASILLFVPRTQPLGGLMSTAIMSGAIFFHVASPLGIDPYDDGGKLFAEACAVWAAGLVILWLRRDRARQLLADLHLLPEPLRA